MALKALGSIPVALHIPTGSTVEVRRGALVTLFVVLKNMSWLRCSSSLNFCRVCFVVAMTAATCAQIAAAPPTDSADDISPAALVRAAVANEIAASQDTSLKYMFRSRKQTPRGSQTRLYVETREAIAAMTIAYDDKRISGEQLQGEFHRLQHLIVDRDDLRRKQKQEREDTEHTLRIVKAMPDAFVYEFDGTEPSQPGTLKPGDELIRLKFQPNPHYTPPSRVEQVLMGMQGTVLIDKNARRLTRIHATLFREVSFGWGILGHLDKGGSFLVEQADVGDGTWEITHIQLNFTGKIMMVKSLVIKSDETLSDFQRVPDDITFAKGVELLKQEWAKSQYADSSTATASKTRQ
jgi:hypothetical protein